ncbi:MAG: class I SAM-dependent methyltransferase [Anaerolineaceae bacterium]
MSLLFQRLYTTLAWAYDFIAAAVSFGRWNAWIEAVIPYLDSSPVLELGSGPGHLQVALAKRGIRVYGLDPSPQMCQRAQRRLRIAGFIPKILRGRAEKAPFENASFVCMAATFPAPYLFTPAAAQEVFRLLQPGGKLIVLLSAQIGGTHLAVRLIHLLLHWTGQQPSDALIGERLLLVFEQAGLEVKIQHEKSNADELLLFIIHRP